MRYHVVHIEKAFEQEWQEDVFDQTLFDLGFDTIDGNDYYIPTDVWETNKVEIEALCRSCKEVQWLGAEACEDKNWNAAWEAEHEIVDLPKGVRIVPHCAFGAGHHETTSMLIDQILSYPMEGKTVLDNGCGTGVLGIMAAKCGAERVVAVDIDDKSVDNTRENAILNGVMVEVQLGCTPPDGQYDLILSNIHRNILIAQMDVYARLLKEGGEVWMSGFMEGDCAAIVDAADKQGLRHKDTKKNGEWYMLMFSR